MKNDTSRHNWSHMTDSDIEGLRGGGAEPVRWVDADGVAAPRSGIITSGAQPKQRPVMRRRGGTVRKWLMIAGAVVVGVVALKVVAMLLEAIALVVAVIAGLAFAAVVFGVLALIIWVWWQLRRARRQARGGVPVANQVHIRTFRW